MLDNPTLEIDREKNEVTIKCNGDTIKFKDDNVEVTRASKNMMFKSPDITPQLAISAFTVLHQYCSSISPHDCIRCAFYISIHVPAWGTTANFHKYSLLFYAINIIFLLFIIPSLFSLVLFILLF